jgi:hypothetical protein
MNTPTEFSKDQLNQILEEISIFKVDLEEDPTQPHLGTRYLQRVIAQCRQYLNRVQFYLQQVKRYEKNLRHDVKQHELDLEFKMNEKLADDALVRRQQSIADRRAVAITLLKEEHDVLSHLRIGLLDVEETVKLIKTKYDDLGRTNGDIKLQRQLIRDDKQDQLHGDEGYSAPQTRQDRTVPGGLRPPIMPKQIAPSDLLDPNARPEDMPEPRNTVHAGMIADFFASQPRSPVASVENNSKKDSGSEAPLLDTISAIDLLD